MTCEFFVRYSAAPARRQVCGEPAPRTLVLALPQRNNVSGEQRVHLCQEHYRNENLTLVTP